MKTGGDKCAHNWSIAWICCFINFLLLGVSRLSGLLYLASISRYNVDRSRAALPFVLCYAIRNISGPLIGYLGRKVEIRLLVACGCFISAIGAGACYFAEDIVTVTVLWGGVYGLGFGLGTILLPQILNQHFEKYLSNANGIAFGGECVAGFVLPVIVELFLDSYGTSGTFLILSGLILHGVPAALLLRSPDSSREQLLNKEGLETNTYDSTTSSLIHNEACTIANNSYPTKCNVADCEEKFAKSSGDRFDKSCFPKKEFNSHLENYENPISETYKSSSSISFEPSSDHYRPHSDDTYIENTDESIVNKLYSKCSINDKQYSLVPGTEDPYLFQRSSKVVNDCQTTHDASTYIKNSNHNDPSSKIIQKPTPKSSSRSSFRLFLDPPFILILLTQSSMIFIFATVLTVIVDFSRDAGVPSHQEVYVLMCLSLADMLGRFGLGWVTDLNYMSNIAFSAICYAGAGVVMVGMVFLRGFPLTMLVAFFIGLFLGGLLIVSPGIIRDYIDEEEVTMALASRFVLFAPMSLTQSSLIGYFRERLGSYNGLFYILAFNCMLCCIFSLSVPCAARRRNSRKARKDAHETDTLKQTFH